MARILSDETTLSRQRRLLSTETSRLHRLIPVEAGLAAVLSAAGLVLLLLRGRSGLLWTGLAVGFLAAGHYLKERQNRSEQQNLKAGQRGEDIVAKRLAESLDNSYYLYNDLTIRSGFKRAQIDHLVVSPKGLFVVETKNWGGRLVGDERDPSWLKYRHEGEPPRTVSNPVLQNQRHVTVLQGFLRSHGLPALRIIPLLVFTSRYTDLQIRSQRALLLGPTEAVDYINRYQADPPYDEATVDAVLNRLQRVA